MNKKGNKTWVSPIKRQEDIERILALLAPSPRNTAIFVTGINTNLRASDLVALRIKDVEHLRAGDPLVNRDQKVSRYVVRAVNKLVTEKIRAWLAEHPGRSNPEAPLFLSQRNCAITVPSLSRLVKEWCQAAGLRSGNYASHSLRKTWAFWAIEFGVPFYIVSAALGHRDHETTLTYLGIQQKAIRDAFMNEIGRVNG